MYSDIVRLLDSEEPIPRETVRQWIATGDLQTHGGVFALLERAPERVEPPLPPHERMDFARRYLLRCILENPRPSDAMHGGWQAAWALAAKLKEWRRAGGRTADQLRGVAIELERLYRRGDPATQNRILCGVLEHAFEEPALRPYFVDWERDAELRDAYRLAVEWGDTHAGS